MSLHLVPRAGLRANVLFLSIALGLAACGGGGGGGEGGNPAAAVQAAAIATQPAPQSADAGANATFAVNATGNGLAYQWKRDGQNSEGATAASYTLNDVQASDDGAVFAVEVRNSLGSVVSGGAALRVTTPKGLSLLAGRIGGPGNLDGKDGRFGGVYGLAVGPSGALLFSEPAGEQGRLRSVDPATGTIATLSDYPKGSIGYLMESDAAGNRYELTGWAIYKTTPANVRTLLAGSDIQTYEAVDGPGAKARFRGVYDMTIDGAGNLYVTDDRVVRKIDPAGNVSTLAGNGNLYAVDGMGSKASFSRPTGIAADKAGNLYVVDAGSSIQPTQLRKVTPQGAVTTLPLKAGDGAGPVQTFGDYGGALAIDDAGNVYLTDTSQGCRIRKVAADGTVTGFAGSATAYGNVDGKGAAARFCRGPGGPLQAMTIDKAGNLYLYDGGNFTMRRITPAGDVTTVAGRAPEFLNVDGKGGAARFTVEAPTLRLPDYYRSFVPFFSLVADAQGNAFVGAGDRIRKVTPSGTVSTLAAAAAGAGATANYFPGSLGVAGGSALMVSDNVVSRVGADGTVRFIAGQPGMWKGAADGTGAGAVFESPYDLVVDGLGNIFLHDVVFIGGFTYLPKVVQRRIGPDGVVTTLPDAVSGSPISAWCPDKEGGVWAASVDGSVSRIGVDGTRKVVVPPAERFPTAIARDAAGNLYLAARKSSRPLDSRGDWFDITKIAPDGTQTIVAGTAGTAGTRLGAPGSLGYVFSMTAGPDGILYVMSEGALLKLKP